MPFGQFLKLQYFFTLMSSRWEMYSNKGLRPVFLSTEVIKKGGISSQLSDKACKNVSVFLFAIPGLLLSALVKTNAKGISHLPSLLINSMSIACVLCLLSTSINKQIRFFLFLIYPSIICSHLLLSCWATFAYPYPGRSTRYHFVSFFFSDCPEEDVDIISKWFINCVLPGLEEVFASFLLLHIKFIKEDFPTLLRPKNANSGLSGFGHFS